MDIPSDDIFEARYMRIVPQMAIDVEFGLRLEIHGCEVEAGSSPGKPSTGVRWRQDPVQVGHSQCEVEAGSGSDRPSTDVR